MNTSQSQNEIQNEHESGETPAAARFAWGPAGLWASAFVLVGLILLHTAGLLDRPAYADSTPMTLKHEELSALTTDVGNFDALFVVDDRTQKLLVYTGVKGKGIQLEFAQDLPTLFSAARAGRRDP